LILRATKELRICVVPYSPCGRCCRPNAIDSVQPLSRDEHSVKVQQVTPDSDKVRRTHRGCDLLPGAYPKEVAGILATKTEHQAVEPGLIEGTGGTGTSTIWALADASAR
jgi:hypothetical protein